MDCPDCQSKNTKKINNKTASGYEQYRCCKCHRQYNERTGTKLNLIEYPTEVVMIAVHYYLLQTRMAVLNNELHEHFRRWCKSFAIANDEIMEVKKVA